MTTIHDGFDTATIETICLADDTKLTIRALIPTDQEKLKEYFTGLSSTSKYNRYFNHKKNLSSNELWNCLNSDPKNHYTIGAWSLDTLGAENKLVGTASYVHLHDTERSAEFAIIIADAWQHKGLGKYLVRAVLAAAKRAKVERMLVYFLPSNTGMKKLTQSMSDEVSFKYEEGTVVADFLIEKDEVSTYFWQGEVAQIWDNLFQAAIDVGFMPLTLYMNFEDNNSELINSITRFHHMKDFEKWLDSIEDA